MTVIELEDAIREARQDGVSPYANITLRHASNGNVVDNDDIYVELENGNLIIGCEA